MEAEVCPLWHPGRGGVGAAGNRNGVGQLSLHVHVTDHVVQFSRLGGSLDFTLSEMRLGDL